MERSFRGKRLCAALTAAVLILLLSPAPRALADRVLLEDPAASGDQRDTAARYAGELSDTGGEEYYRKSSTSYLASLILSMASGNAYRLVLDSGYPEVIGSAQNASENARSVWQVMADGYARTPWSFLLDQTDGSETFWSLESAAGVGNLLRRILGAGDERLANFDGILDPETMWEELKAISGGDTYTFADTVQAGGSREPRTGDTVYFRLTAYCGGSGDTQSRSEHRRVRHPMAPEAPGLVTEWTVAEDPDTGEPAGSEGDSALPEYIAVTRPYEISYAYVGMVLSAGPQGIRSICGNLDLTQTGQLTAQPGVPVSGAEGLLSRTGEAGETLLLPYAGPDWHISVTMEYCPTVIDTRRVLETLYSTYVVEDGPCRGRLISFDIRSGDLAEELREKTGYTEEQCRVLAEKLRILYISEVLEAEYGLTVPESLAWQQALLLYTGGDFSGQGILDSLPPDRAREYRSWLEQRELEPDTGNFLEFLQHSVQSDGALLYGIRVPAVTETGTPEENRQADLERILDLYFGSALTGSEIRRLTSPEYYSQGSLQRTLALFLSRLAEGGADLGRLVPLTRSAAAGGLLEWVPPSGGEGGPAPIRPELILIQALEG